MLLCHRGISIPGCNNQLTVNEHMKRLLFHVPVLTSTGYTAPLHGSPHWLGVLSIGSCTLAGVDGDALAAQGLTPSQRLIRHLAAARAPARRRLALAVALHMDGSDVSPPLPQHLRVSSEPNKPEEVLSVLLDYAWW
jgi:hypothetical protein